MEWEHIWRDILDILDCVVIQEPLKDFRPLERSPCGYVEEGVSSEGVWKGGKDPCPL